MGGDCQLDAKLDRKRRSGLTCPLSTTALPEACRVVSVDSHGKANWARGLKVVVDLDNEKHAYFLKVCIGRSQALAHSIV